MIPGGTYRIQLNAGFRFEDAARIVDYLAALGITHLYCSPYLQSAPGSTHGYDIVDPRRLNEELGGSIGFESLRQALDESGLGLIMDIVPNHMAADASNPWWWDVLRNGPISPYASFFDIQWEGDDDLSTLTVLVPILSDHYGRVLETGEIEVIRQDGSLVVRYGDHQLPLSPQSLREPLEAASRRADSTELSELAEAFGSLPTAERTDREAIARRHQRVEDLTSDLEMVCASDLAAASSLDAELKEINRDPDRLDSLLGEQNYRLAHWRTANEELDYRRFFNIETLIGLRVESRHVFNETHSLIFQMVGDGTVSGLRVDHVDGLADPKSYLSQLAEATDEIYTVVEKILEPGESLPRSWPIDGTTGYDFLNRVNNLFVASESESAISNLYRSFTGEAATYTDIVRAAKLQIMETQLAVEMQRLTGLLSRICQRYRRHRDHTRRDLTQALGEVVANFGVYRTYVRPPDPPTRADRTHVRDAVQRSLDREPGLDAELVRFIGELALGALQGGLEAEFCQRMQQVTAPVMAKGVEDTAFYRYNRFVSLNEVGGDPGTFGHDATRFHDETSETAANWPGSMLTLSTHDTKRSADVRARLNVLSEIPVAWRNAVEDWAEHNTRHRVGPWPDRNAEYLLYQTVVGAWPIEADRVVAFMEKATREAKLQTSWLDPDPDYEEALERFVRAILADSGFVTRVETALAEHEIVSRGHRNSLAQLGLLLTSPGVPDIYQGSESWDFSLVDPDNRRPVDYAGRRRLLERVGSADMTTASGSPGGLKLWLTHRLLQHRLQNPELYRTKTYEPITAAGEMNHQVVGFRRDRLLVLVACRTNTDWDRTHVNLPPGRWADVLRESSIEGGKRSAGELLGDLPLTVLASARK